MACIIKTKTNGQPSILFDTILTGIANNDIDIAKEHYAYFETSPVFLRDFATDDKHKSLHWQDDFKKPFYERTINQRRVDENGQPLLQFDKKYGKHFYINESGVKVNFPIAANKLNSMFTNTVIRKVTKKLALNFVSSRIGDNFNDFDFAANTISLRENIENKLKSKIEELNKSGDLDQMISSSILKESLGNIDEWVKHVDDFFREIKLVYNETTETEDLNNLAETERGQQYGKASFEKGTKDNISANIKLRLSLLTDLLNKKNDIEVGTIDEYFFEPELMEFDAVYSDLSGILTNNIALPGEDLYEIYIKQIQNLTTKKPYLKGLLSTLENTDDYIKAEFVQAFNLHKNTFIGSIYDVSKKGIVKHTVQNLSDVGAKSRFVKTNWQHNFNKNISEKGNITEKSKAKLISFNKAFKSILPTKENLDDAILRTRKGLEQLGVATTPEGFNHYLDGLEAGGSETEFKVQQLKKLMKAINYSLVNTLNEKIDVTKTNIFDNQSEYNNLAKAHAFYLSELSDASFFSTGKARWIYSYPSYLSSKIKSWQKDRNILLKHYNSTPFNKGSYYMRFLLALDENVSEEERVKISQNRLNNFELNVLNSLQERGKANEAVDNQDISIDDFFADIYNKMLGFRKTNGRAYINTVTPADKGTQYQFALPKEMTLLTNARFIDGKIVINSSILDILFNYVKSEFNRIKLVEKEIKLAEKTGDYSKLKMYYHYKEDGTRPNGLNFQLFTDLNIDKFNNKESGFSLYKGNDLVKMNLDTVKNQIISIIEETVGKDIKATGAQLRSIGLIDINEKGKYINKALDSKIWESYEKEVGTEGNISLKIAGDIYINGLISQIEYSKMFAGDVAYYKNMSDYKKRIPATYTDGLQLYLRKGEENFNIAVIKDVAITSPFNEQIKELYTEEEWEEIGKLYERKVDKNGKILQEGIDSTDGQAWITPKRWKFLKERLGLWHPIDDIVYSKLIGENKENFTIEELKRGAQPLKGVYFEINSGVPVYLKYSQAVLTPKLIKGNKGLEMLSKKMEEFKVDELVTFQGIKVGSSIPTETHDELGNVIDNIELNVITLKNSGWKLQQNLPTKGFKNSDVGSQIQKNIFSGLAFNTAEVFDVDGVEMSGNELIDYINSIIENLTNKGLEQLKREFNIDGDYKINNTRKLTKALVEQLISKGASQNVIDGLESGLILPAYQQKLQNIFSSISLKRIVKIQTNGGAFIQMSNYGLSNDEATKKGVIWTPWSDKTTSEPKFLKDDKGEFILSKNDKKIITGGGILIPGSFIAKYVPGYTKMSNEKLFGTKENNYTDGVIDQRILRNLIGYRIPNQALASNDALEIAGILSEESGDTIIAYTGITTKTGSDFDIDKMFIMMPSFFPTYSKNSKNKGLDYIRDNELTIPELREELEAINYSTENLSEANIKSLFIEEILLNQDEGGAYYDEFQKIISTEVAKKLTYINPKKDNKGVELPLDEQSVKALQNKLIQAYKAVLLHPKVMKDVMKPIDYPFMKDDINNLIPEKKGSNLSDFNLINEINLKYAFLLSKAGIGQTANSLMDHIRGTMADISLNKHYLGIGNENKEGETTFDNEFSQELSEKDLKYYNKVTKKDNSIFKKIKIAESLSAILNAYVDIAKDNYITRGNWTTQTSNVGFMLLRSGVHPFYVNAILAQPIIREYIRFTVNSESKINRNSGNLVEKYINNKIEEKLDLEEKITIGEITKSFKNLFVATHGVPTIKNLNKVFNTKISNEDFNTIKNTISRAQEKFAENVNFKIKDLSLQNLREQITKEEDASIQLDIFYKFINWQQKAKQVTNNIKASKFDVNGYGKNTSSLIIIKNLINKLLTEENIEEGNFKGFISKLIKNNKLTFLGAYKENIIDYMSKVMENNPLIFPIANSTVVNTFNEISKGITSDILLNDKLATKLEKSYYTYMMADFTPFQMDVEDRRDILYNVPNELDAYSKKSDSLLVNELSIKLGEDAIDFIGMSNRQKSVSVENDLVAAWADLLRDNPELGERLIKYAYLTSGFQMNINQFYTFIPFEWFVKNNLNDYITDFITNLNSSSLSVDNDFTNNFVRSNIEDYSIVGRIYDNQISSNYASSKFGFVLEEQKLTRKWVKNKLTIKTKGFADVEIDRLYELQGYTEKNEPVYLAIGNRGYTNRKGLKVFEYIKDSENDDSLFITNNIPDMTIEISNSFRNLVHTNQDGSVINDVSKFSVKNAPIEEISVEDIKEDTQLNLFTQPAIDEFKLKDGKVYLIDEINTDMLEEMGYTPEESGEILKEICL